MSFTLRPKTQSELAQGEFESVLSELRLAILNNHVPSVDECWEKLTNLYKNAAGPLLKRIGTRIREEAKSAFYRANSKSNSDKMFASGYEQGLSKAWSMLKSIVQGEYSQHNKLIEEIEKTTEY